MKKIEISKKLEKTSPSTAAALSKILDTKQELNFSNKFIETIYNLQHMNNYQKQAENINKDFNLKLS